METNEEKLSREGYYGKATESVKDLYEREYKALSENYTAGVKGLQDSKNASEEMAAVTRERMLKYLPQQMRAQGINTQGVSEDALIKAHNNYQNTMTDITANYDTQKGAMDRQFTADSNVLTDKKESSLLALEKEQLEHEESMEKEKKTHYASIFEKANSGQYTGEQIEELSTNLGMDPTTAQELKNTATTAYEQSLAEKYDVHLKQGVEMGYSYQQMYDRAIALGYSPTDAERMGNKAEDYRIEKEVAVRSSIVNDRDSALEFEKYLDENSNRLPASTVKSYKKALVDAGYLESGEIITGANGEKSEAVLQYQALGGNLGKLEVKVDDAEYDDSEDFTLYIDDKGYELHTSGEYTGNKDDYEDLTSRYKEIHGENPSIGSLQSRITGEAPNEKSELYVYLKNEHGGCSWFGISDIDDYENFMTALGIYEYFK